MKVSQRLKLIDRIGRELQARYGYSDIDIFLKSFEITPPVGDIGYNSKWVYSKEALKNANNNQLLTIAEELELDTQSSEFKGINPPQIWQDSKTFRLFISHLAIHKDKAIRLKETLTPYHISSFVAHEDINPSKEWQNEIEKGLHTMDAMITIHTKGFSESVWTQQEIGFALCKGVKILSLRIDEDPKGFISKHQAILRRGRTAEEISEEINSIIINDALTKDKMAEIRSAHQKIDDDDIPF